MPSSTDQRVLDDLHTSRSESALAELMERHGAMVLATCERITGDRHDAEESAQTVFLILWRKSGSLGRVDCLAAWLHRTARFVALRARTTRLRRSRRESPLGAMGDPSNGVGEPENELLERLDAALDRLPAIYREALLLHYVEGRACDEIAVMVGASLETIAMRLSRGRERLRRRLSRCPTDAFTRTLAGVASMPTTALTVDALHSPTPAVQVLLHGSLAALRAGLIAMITGAVAVVVLAVGAAVIAQNLVAAEPHPGSSPAPSKPSAVRGMGMPLCEPWEAQLQAGLQRPVTVHAVGADALVALRQAGERCEVPMVIALTPDHGQLPGVTVDADGAPLGVVLDAIARQTGLRYCFRAGTLWWEESSPLPGGGPTVLWVYWLDPAKVPGGDPAQVVDELRTSVGNWEHEGVGIEQRSFIQLFVNQTPATQLQIEKTLRDRLWLPSADDRKAQASATAVPVTFSDRPSGERRLRAALAVPVALAPRMTRLTEVVDAVAKAARVRITADHGVSLDRPLPHFTANISLQGLEARHVLELALIGTGLHYELRASPADADGSVVIAAGTAPMVKRRYDLTTLTRARKNASGVEVMTPDTQEFIDILQEAVMPNSWNTDGVSIHEEEGAVIVLQTVAVQDAIEEVLSRLARLEFTGDASGRCAVPPALALELSSSRTSDPRNASTASP